MRVCVASWQDQEHPRLLIPELCRLFYQLGWVTGTGGGVSLRHRSVKLLSLSVSKQFRFRPGSSVAVVWLISFYLLPLLRCTPLRLHILI